MAGRIQGITVEIGGDTTKLQTALKGVKGRGNKENAPCKNAGGEHNCNANARQQATENYPKESPKVSAPPHRSAACFPRPA